MIVRKYTKTSTAAKQILTTQIKADRETVFHYLATTEGLSNWFPQLSIEEKKDEKSVVFDLGNGTFERMSLLDDSTNEHIAFEWATGKVEFQLEAVNENTQLTLTETLPLEFPALVQDFTGWYVQMKNIKSVVETGLTENLEKEEIQKIQREIQEAF